MWDLKTTSNPSFQSPSFCTAIYHYLHLCWFVVLDFRWTFAFPSIYHYLHLGVCGWRCGCVKLFLTFYTPIHHYVHLWLVVGALNIFCTAIIITICISGFVVGVKFSLTFCIPIYHHYLHLWAVVDVVGALNASRKDWVATVLLTPTFATISSEVTLYKYC